MFDDDKSLLTLSASEASLIQEVLHPEYPVLQDISFDIGRGQTLGIIGESGCGKSTLARVIAGLLPMARGAIGLAGQTLAPSIAHRSRDQLRRCQIVYQIADTALNPAHTMEDILGRPLTFYHGLKGRERGRRIEELLDMVRLPKEVLTRRHYGLSGGQKQRINLARALAAKPDLILCDEVTSALDSVVGAAVLDLLAELQRELGISYLFISHDLATVRSICDDVIVLYAGQMMEKGNRSAINTGPWHPYSDLLISSVPELRTGWLDSISPQRADALMAQTGKAPRGKLCSFHPRCPYAQPNVCDAGLPPERWLSKGAAIQCQLTENDLRARMSERATFNAAC